MCPILSFSIEKRRKRQPYKPNFGPHRVSFQNW